MWRAKKMLAGQRVRLSSFSAHWRDCDDHTNEKSPENKEKNMNETDDCGSIKILIFFLFKI